MTNCGQIFSSWKTTTISWPVNVEEKNLSLIDKTLLLKTRRPKQRPRRHALLYEIFLVKSSASKDQIKKHYHKMSLLTHPMVVETKSFSKPVIGHIKF